MRDRIRDGSHSSRRPVAEPLKQPTRAVTDGEPSRRETRRCKHALPLFGLAPGGVYHAACCYQQRGALLPHPFTLTAGVPRCRAPVSGLLSVALSLDFEGFPSRRAGVTRHPCFVEPGLSSAKFPPTRLPGPLAALRLAGLGRRGESCFRRVTARDSRGVTPLQNLHFNTAPQHPARYRASSAVRTTARPPHRQFRHQ